MGLWEVTVPPVDIIAMTPDEEDHYQFIAITDARLLHPPALNPATDDDRGRKISRVFVVRPGEKHGRTATAACGASPPPLTCNKVRRDRTSDSSGGAEVQHAECQRRLGGSHSRSHDEPDAMVVFALGGMITASPSSTSAVAAVGVGPDPGKYPSGGKDHPCDGSLETIPAAARQWSESPFMVRDEDAQRGEFSVGPNAAGTVQLFRANSFILHEIAQSLPDNLVVVNDRRLKQRTRQPRRPTKMSRDRCRSRAARAQASADQWPSQYSRHATVTPSTFAPILLESRWLFHASSNPTHSRDGGDSTDC
jgi:hypothetical protein